MKGYANAGLLATPEELARAIGTSSPPLVIDLRPSEDFVAGHIPGAVHLDLWGVSLIDTDPAPLKAFMWMIDHLFNLRGVTAATPVVVYDEQSGMRAARAFWFLEYFGHPGVRLLDGGFGAWVRANLPVTREPSTPAKSTWSGMPQEQTIATWRDVQSRLGNPDVVLLDTRSDGEWSGATVRARRGGHIPGAVHVEWTRNLDAQGAFKPAAELRAMYEQAGVTPDKEVVTYCQGGYRAAHSYLALRLLGYPRVRNYTGSWKEWGDRTELPVESPRASDLAPRTSE
jgi:thiosulfate/3-mercaptopyruvate sulfurtransferase